MFCLSTSAGAGRTIARRSLLRFGIQQRRATPAVGYATASPYPLVTATKLEHGLNVIAVDDGADVCVVSLAFPAGPRYERVHEPGLAHHLKNWAFQDSRSSTALATAREAEIRGGILSASLTREHLFLTAECLRKDLQFFLETLREAAYHTKFQVFEANSIGYLVSVETSRAFTDPETVINESLHRVAFRHGLGSCLFAHSRASLDLSTVKAFGARQSTISGKVALVASGIGVDELERHANELLSPAHITLAKSMESTQTSKYYGGEDRIDAPSAEMGYLAVAYPSGASGSAFESAAHVLKAYLGGAKPGQYRTATNPMAKAASAIGARFQPFAYSYSDAGLFGILIKSGYDKAQQATSAAVAEIKKAAEGIPEAEFNRAVATAKTSILSSLENKVTAVEFFGAQVLGNGKVVGPTKLISSLDALKPADVSKLAATMIKSKPSVVAYGNTMALPYADSL